MPDEAPEATQDTPDAGQPAAPDTGTPASDESVDSQAQTQDTTDWKSRYENLQPEYTRASQEAAELRQYRDTLAAAKQGDKEAQRWIADLMEWELDLGGDEEEEETETQVQADPRMDHLWEAFQAQQAERELDTLESHVDTEIDKLAESARYKLSDDERDLIFAALTPKQGDPHTPDVEAAFKKITGLRDAHIKDYRAGKLNPTPQAPSGSSPSHQPDLDDDTQRREYIAQRMAGG